MELATPPFANRLPPDIPKSVKHERLTGEKATETKEKKDMTEDERSDYEQDMEDLKNFISRAKTIADDMIRAIESNNPSTQQSKDNAAAFIHDMMGNLLVAQAKKSSFARKHGFVLSQDALDRPADQPV